MITKLGFLFLLFCLYATLGQATTIFENPASIEIPAGKFIFGSSRAEREYAYRLDEKAYGHNITRKNKWYENETLPTQLLLKTYKITKTAITNSQYEEFIKETHYPAPYVDETTWNSYGLIHPYGRVKKFLWANQRPPIGRESHPVVLISYADATRYANWLSEKTHKNWRLPNAAEWEKAARGIHGNFYPWGSNYKPNFLNSHDLGPFDTQVVGSHPEGASPYGVLDMAGQVYEWTTTAKGNNRHFVKGGSWDDKGCGVCRSAASHSRANEIKHILIGFRLVQETN